jgi:integrase
MPRKPHTRFVACEFFTWRLFRRDGVYYADARGGKYNLGRHSLRTENEAEAKALLKELDRAKAIEIGLAAAPPARVNADVLIEDGWQDFLEHRARSQLLGGVSARTLKRYRAVHDKHVAFCKRRSINTWAAFDKRKLEEYGNWLAKHHADRTCYFELTLLKGINGWLIDEGRLTATLKLIYPLRKPTGTDTYCYAPTEVAAMVDHCAANPQLRWLGDVILALAHTGLRIGELAALRWSDVNLGRDLLQIADERGSKHKRKAGTVRTTKGRRSRIIPIHPTFKQCLVELERRPDGLVFHAMQGGILRPRNVLQVFIDHVIEPLKAGFPTPAGEIGFEHGRLHSFRHYFCSQAFLGGASEGEIREWLGHADSKMVEHYRHLRHDDAQRKMAAIEFLDRRDDRRGGVA